MSYIHTLIITILTKSHFDLALKALLAWKDIFVLVLSVAEREKLVNEAKYRGRIFFVGHVLKYYP